ncbi:response regulator transcription factor [Rubritalea sp.]|uniref:response regulator transcription factor n=1 Tax=Rubritalea sp. TaxID=2109375 RepID=UPI003EF53D4C
MQTPTILVIEDDTAIRNGVVDILQYAGYQTIEAADGHQGMKAALECSYNLLLLDVVMPGPSGFDILEALRKKRPGQAVIMLTARGEERDRIHGLTHGADDYVVKPFSMKELLARVDAVLRRSCERVQNNQTVQLSHATIDFKHSKILFPSEEETHLSEKEAQLLQYFTQSENRIVSKAELLQHVWGLQPQHTETRTVDVHIMNLRQKLRDSQQQLITTARGKGYQFHPNAQL